MTTASPSNKPAQSPILNAIKPFLFGGISGCTATAVIQPIDTVKVRIQIVSQQLADLMKAEGQTGKPEVGFMKIGREILKNDGVKGFYKGLDSALMRQIFYGTARLGLFTTFSNYIKTKNGRNLTPFEKAYCSLTAGMIGAFIGNPADLILVRMQSDTLLPMEQRRGYTNFFNALLRIPQEEGILSLWVGVSPTIARAMSMNLGMLATYDECKERFDKFRGVKDLTSTRVVSSAIAGVVGATLTLPFDNIKTKLQSMKPGVDGQMPYRGVIDCFIKSAASEGILGLWVGLPTFLFRVSPHAIITLLTLDALTSWGKTW